MNKDYYMNPQEWKNFNKDKKLFNSIAKNRFYCKCGHSVTMSSKTEKRLCTYCNLWVYRDPIKQEEYLKKLKEDEDKIKSYLFRKEMYKHIRR